MTVSATHPTANPLLSEVVVSVSQPCSKSRGPMVSGLSEKWGYDDAFRKMVLRERSQERMCDSIENTEFLLPRDNT